METPPQNKTLLLRMKEQEATIAQHAKLAHNVQHRAKLAASPSHSPVHEKRKSWDSPRRLRRRGGIDYAQSVRLGRALKEGSINEGSFQEFLAIGQEYAGGMVDDSADWTEGLQLRKMSSKDQIIAGHPEKLLSHLVDLQEQDRAFVDEFLFSYRHFWSPEELLAFLFKRYLFLPDETITQRQMVLWAKYLPLIQSRVVNVLRKWLAAHFYDFESNIPLLQELECFLENVIKPTQPNEKWYTSLKVLIHEQVAITSPLVIRWDEPSASDIFKAAAMREESGIPTTVVKKNNKLYCKCFMGIHAVDWLMKHIRSATSAEAAIQICDDLLAKGIIVPLDDKTVKKGKLIPFKCGKDMYRFADGPVTQQPPLDYVSPTQRRRSAVVLSLASVHPADLGRQLTLFSARMYKQIIPSELMTYCGNDKARKTLRRTAGNCGVKGSGIVPPPATASPATKRLMAQMANYASFTSRWDTVARWATGEVLSCSGIGQRIDVVRALVKTAQTLLEENNFFDLSAIVCGLNNSSVSRLANTWKGVGKDLRKKFRALLQLISPEDSYRALREATQAALTAHKPVVPHIAIYAIDLEHMSQVPNQLPDGMINWHKMRVVSSIAAEMVSLRDSAYEIAPLPEYQEFVSKIEAPPVQEDATLWRRSLLLEPREVDKSRES